MAVQAEQASTNALSASVSINEKTTNQIKPSGLENDTSEPALVQSVQSDGCAAGALDSREHQQPRLSGVLLLVSVDALVAADSLDVDSSAVDSLLVRFVELAATSFETLGSRVGR